MKILKKIIIILPFIIFACQTEELFTDDSIVQNTDGTFSKTFYYLTPAKENVKVKITSEKIGAIDELRKEDVLLHRFVQTPLEGYDKVYTADELDALQQNKSAFSTAWAQGQIDEIDFKVEIEAPENSLQLWVAEISRMSRESNNTIARTTAGWTAEYYYNHSGIRGFALAIYGNARYDNNKNFNGRIKGHQIPCGENQVCNYDSGYNNLRPSNWIGNWYYYTKNRYEGYIRLFGTATKKDFAYGHLLKVSDTRFRWVYYKWDGTSL